MTDWAGQRAVISPCERYRYWLSRELEGDGPPVGFIMLNPSTADAELDDPTIRRCTAFAKAWGARELIVVNLFAYRATDPADLKKASAPIGPENDDAIMAALDYCSDGRIIAAWGTHGKHKRRGDAVRRKAKHAGHKLHYLKMTGSGHPSHPLYLKADLLPMEWL